MNLVRKTPSFSPSYLYKVSQEARKMFESPVQSQSYVIHPPVVDFKSENAPNA